MKSNYSTMLFDFDGTLVSSLEVWLKAYHYALSHYQLILPDEIVIKKCFYRSFEDVIAEFNLPNNEKFGQLVYEGLHQFIVDAELFNGVKETLLDSLNLNIKLAVVTSAPRTVVEKALKKLGIASFFDTLVTAEDIQNFKPHPEPMLLALKRLDSKAQNSLVIGDAIVDILSGQAAGMHTGLFFPENHHIFYDFKKLKDANPYFVFHHYDELDACLTQAKLGTTTHT